MSLHNPITESSLILPNRFLFFLDIEFDSWVEIILLFIVFRFYFLAEMVKKLLANGVYFQREPRNLRGFYADFGICFVLLLAQVNKCMVNERVCLPLKIFSEFEGQFHFRKIENYMATFQI